ncbi:MAG: IS481 family transposase [Acidimicrobiaceae bacterium]|nr:IS481 family transposase [Acidimicrobiaceae bacterium]
MADRSSRPHSSPRRTPARVEERVCRLRRSTRRGPVYLGARTGVPAATVWRILQRNGLNRLAWIDRPTGRVIRRYERSSPGELVHLDVKKVGQIPPGGGWRVHGRGSPAAKRKRRPVGYTYLHVAIDDYSRVAYVEAHDDETAATLVKFWHRAQVWFWSNDMPVDEVLTDNGPNFVSDAFAEVLAERRIVHRRTRPCRPQTNGKAERFNRTLADEFLYAKRFRSESERRIRLRRWIHDYNCHRHHTAVGGPPASRPYNLTRTDI